MTAERINRLTGPMLITHLESKQKDFEEIYDQNFNVDHKIISKELSVGRAALSNLLGGIGYFYGQSKIALPKGFTQKMGINIFHIGLLCYIQLCLAAHSSQGDFCGIRASIS